MAWRVQMRVCEFFFFQAEDGIRDIGVTGVQTCALPIYITQSFSAVTEKDWVMFGTTVASQFTGKALDVLRSEERRVGKEWRSRWWPYHDRKKKCGRG